MGRKRIEIIGQKFNKLTVIKNDPDKYYNVIVECECGEIKSVSKTNLKKYRIFSCNIGKCNVNYYSVINMKFNKLLILDIDDDNIDLAKVKCDCGKIFNISKKSVVSGHTKSCGGSICNGRITNLINKTFGKLKVIRFCGLSKRNQARWECLCECSNIVIKESRELLNKCKNKSCGCSIGLGAAIKVSLPFGFSIKNKIFARYKRNAISRNLIFDISFDTFIKLISDSCHYCGVKPSTKHKVNNILYEQKYIYFNGVDRKNNDIGYVADNVLTCCTICNFAKRTMSYDEFIQYLNRITCYRNSLNKSA